MLMQMQTCRLGQKCISRWLMKQIISGHCRRTFAENKPNNRNHIYALIFGYFDFCTTFTFLPHCAAAVRQFAIHTRFSVVAPGFKRSATRDMARYWYLGSGGHSCDEFAAKAPPPLTLGWSKWGWAQLLRLKCLPQTDLCRRRPAITFAHAQAQDSRPPQKIMSC
ncbi:uncharacterized protein LOC122612815 [Drosophila teissieri]|uniref:uncharacterized protein LOC122612815 n=1 Tax=Drosophila teissieri TaxID=7243 RepID=UPI001CB9E604|nr:uncharacterized protein LOC122612815 [Drosophila teissieri]